jgi:16S rRNA (cytosine967-C5)-methyltransferase
MTSRAVHGHENRLRELSSLRPWQHRALSNPRQRGTSPARTGFAARQIAALLIGRVVDDHRSLDMLTDETAGLAPLRALDQRDRALARAIAVTALRHRGEIDRALARMVDRKPPQKARHLLHTLHAAAAQILYMDVPDSAAVDLAVTAISQDNRTTRFAAMANAVLRRLAREKELLDLPRDAATVFPPWLAAELRRDHGRENADAIARAILDEPVIDITPSPRLSNAEIAELALAMNARILPTGSLRLAGDTPVRELPGYADGAWWVQDAASALPVRLFGDVSGKRMADLCAAPGGKTAQLASLGAHVTAVDISPPRLARLHENMARLKLDVASVAADILEWEPEEKFDAVLLDAPCSSTGTIRRHPDVIWTKTPQDVEGLAGLQMKLIRKAASLVRPGGMLVYANCSMLKREGENLLAAILREPQGLVHKPLDKGEFAGFENLVNGQGALRTLPLHLPAANGDISSTGGMDGFFACRFEIA